MVALKEDVAMDFARSHQDLEPAIRAVFRVESPAEDNENEPIKLLEVNGNTIERGMEPIIFGAHPGKGMPYALIIIDISPREFELFREGRLPLPNGWKLGRQLLG